MVADARDGRVTVMLQTTDTGTYSKWDLTDTGTSFWPDTGFGGNLHMYVYLYYKYWDLTDSGTFPQLYTGCPSICSITVT